MALFKCTRMPQLLSHVLLAIFEADEDLSVSLEQNFCS